MGRPKNSNTKPAGPPSVDPPQFSGYALAFVIFSRIMEFLKLWTWFGGPALLGYVFVVLPLRETAGKVTTVSFLYQMVFSYRLDLAATSAAAAIFLILWRRERGIRRNTVERMHAQIKELETEIDPGRTTSGLTPRGETPKETP